MKKQLELEDAANNTFYKKRVIIPNLGCPMCPAGRGCNRNHRDKRNWKYYRKYQYK